MSDLFKKKTYLTTRNLSDIFINVNKIHANLNSANPLKKQICRSLINAIRKQKRQ